MFTLIGHRLMALLGAAFLALLLGFQPTDRGIPAPLTSSANTGAPKPAAVCRAKPQTAPVPYHVDASSIHSGRYTATSQDAPQAMFTTLVRSLDAPWLQIQFGSSNLGRNSYVRLTGVQDGAAQELNASLMEAWSKRSAMFAGDAIRIELFAAPDDKDVFFEVESAIVGDWVGGVPLTTKLPSVRDWEPATIQLPLDTVPYKPEMICGVDDRVASNDQAIGRIVPVGCTGWVISNGAFLTAGHCFTPDMTQIQFNVPQSLADGTIQPPKNPNDQYPIDRSNVTWRSNGEGDDWAVFRVSPNMTTTLTPPLAYGSFYRVFLNQPFTVRVTGYGVDGPAPCFGESRQPGCMNAAPPRDASNQTQQTATGASEGRTGDIFEHRVDITGGNSGSPVRHPDFGYAVAIHTHGTIASAACDTGFNSGTAFTNVGLVNAINTFPGPNVRYVDAALSTLDEDGTLIRPFNLLAEGMNAAPIGGIVSVVKGNYNEPMTINKNITLEAPVGTVVIGAP